MKKALILMVALTLVAAGVAFAGVAGSKHDMTTGGLAGGGGNITDGSVSGVTNQVCVFCHHPHKTGKSATQAAVLWNRGVNTETYTIYTRTDDYAATNTVTSDTTADHYSLMCLTCHDSNIALGLVDKSPRAGFTPGSYSDAYIASGLANVAGDQNGAVKDGLRNDHPVGITYSETAITASGEFRTMDAGNNAVIISGRTWPLFDSATGPQDTVQCATCHDVHNQAQADANGATQFIRNDTTSASAMDASNMCSDCHIK